MDPFTEKEATVAVLMALIVGLALTPMLGAWVWIALFLAAWWVCWGLGPDGVFTKN